MAPHPSISNIIKGIESLGGSVGFQSFTGNSQMMLSVADVQGTAVINDYPQATFSVADVLLSPMTRSGLPAMGFCRGRARRRAMRGDQPLGLKTCRVS